MEDIKEVNYSRMELQVNIITRL